MHSIPFAPPLIRRHCSPLTQTEQGVPAGYAGRLLLSLVQNLAPDSWSRQAQMFPSLSRPQSVLFTHTPQALPVQTALAQSLRVEHTLPTAQRMHVPPPQSTSVSLPSLTP